MQIKNHMLRTANSRAVQAFVVVGSLLTGLVASGIAGATYDPTTALTGLGANATATAAPILAVVAGSLIALGVVFWVVRKVLHIFGIRF